MLQWVVKQYSFDLEHRPGLKYSNADVLSRGVYHKCGVAVCPNCKLLVEGDPESTSSDTD